MGMQGNDAGGALAEGKAWFDANSRANGQTTPAGPRSQDKFFGDHWSRLSNPTDRERCRGSRLAQ